MSDLGNWSVPITYQGQTYEIKLGNSKEEGTVPVVAGGITYYTRTIPISTGSSPVLPVEESSNRGASVVANQPASSSLVTATTSSSPTSAASTVKAMQLPSKTSTPLPSIQSRIQGEPKNPTHGTPPPMDPIIEVPNNANAIARYEEKEEAKAKEKEKQNAIAKNEYVKANRTKALLFSMIQTAQAVLKTVRESTNPTTVRDEIDKSINNINSNNDVQRAKTIMRDALNTLHTTSNNALYLTLPIIQKYTTTLMTCMVALAGWKANPSTNNAKAGKITARAAIQAMNGPELSDLQSFTINVNENYTPPSGHTSSFLTPSEMMLDAIARLLQSLNGKTTIQEYTDAMKASFENQTGKSYDDLLRKTGGRQTHRNLRKHPLRNRLTRKNFRRIK